MKSALIATFLLSDGEQLDTEQGSPEFVPSELEKEPQKPMRQPRRKHDPSKDELTAAQIAEISRLQKELNMTPVDGNEVCQEMIGYKKQDLTEDKADEFIALLREMAHSECIMADGGEKT